MTCVHTATIPVGCAVNGPVGIGIVDALGAQRQYGLHVSVAQFGIGFEHERNNAAHNGCCKAGAIHRAIGLAKRGSLFID